VSPILVRPVREQLEHDRVIRLLQAKLKRRHDVVMNIGEEQTTPVRIGQVQVFPDLVLTSTDRGRKLMGTVEVETAESVNHLEALAEWAPPGRLKTPLHLYVPASASDVARRLALDHQIPLAEVWTYLTIGDQVRFTLVHKSPDEAAPASRAAQRPRGKPAKPTPVKPAASRPAAARRKAAAPARKAAKAPARRTAAARSKKSPPVRKAATKTKRK
jgi:hypothetical protein